MKSNGSGGDRDVVRLTDYARASLKPDGDRMSGNNHRSNLTPYGTSSTAPGSNKDRLQSRPGYSPAVRPVSTPGSTSRVGDKPAKVIFLKESPMKIPSKLNTGVKGGISGASSIVLPSGGAARKQVTALTARGALSPAARTQANVAIKRKRDKEPDTSPKERSKSGSKRKRLRLAVCTHIDVIVG